MFLLAQTPRISFRANFNSSTGQYCWSLSLRESFIQWWTSFTLQIHLHCNLQSTCFTGWIKYSPKPLEIQLFEHQPCALNVGSSDDYWMISNLVSIQSAINPRLVNIERHNRGVLSPSFINLNYLKAVVKQHLMMNAYVITALPGIVTVLFILIQYL